MERAKERVEKYIHYNIKDVKSITFTKNDVSPMGVPSVEGYINNDKELWFDASISTTDKFEDKFGCSGELDKMIKNQQNLYLKLKRREGKETRVVSLTTLVSLF